MRKFFSEELLSEIHIKLDKQGLDGLSEKEIMVLNQEATVDSTYLLSAKMGGMTEQLSAKMDDMTEQLSVKMDDMTEQLSARIDGVVKEIGIKIDGAVEPVYWELRHFRRWSKIVAAGIWAVAASLIASLIFKMFWG